MQATDFDTDNPFENENYLALLRSLALRLSFANIVWAKQMDVLLSSVKSGMIGNEGKSLLAQLLLKTFGEWRVIFPDGRPANAKIE